jgi:hypothetical protein
LPEQARVLHDLGLAPSRLDHDLDARPVTRLEGPRRQQREAALGVAEERRAAAQQGAVEVGVDAPERHGEQPIVARDA